MEVNVTEYQIGRLKRMADELTKRSIHYSYLSVEAMEAAKNVEDKAIVLKEKLELEREKMK